MKIEGKDIDVQSLTDKWALSLMQKGVVVKLSIGLWTGQVQLKPETMGVHFSSEKARQAVKKYINFGSQRIIPPEFHNEINALAKRARKCLNSYSFDTLWGRFMPYTAFPEWHEQNETFRKDYEEATRALVARYDEIKDMLCKEYRDIAEDGWKRLYPNSGKPPESFVTNFLDGILSHLPSPTQLPFKYNYETTYYSIPLPTFVENNLNKAADIRRERERKDHEATLEAQSREIIAQDYRERKRELIDNFLTSTVESIRHYIKTMCEEILLNIQDSRGNITKRHAHKIQKLVKEVRLLNFYDDEETTKMINLLNRETYKHHSKVDQKAVINSLQTLQKNVVDEFIPDSFNPTLNMMEID